MQTRLRQQAEYGALRTIRFIHSGDGRVVYAALHAIDLVLQELDGSLRIIIEADVSGSGNTSPVEIIIAAGPEADAFKELISRTWSVELTGTWSA